MKSKAWILLAILFFTLVSYFIWNKWNTLSTDYGRNYNDKRYELHVPPIEENMKQVYFIDSFLANHWEATDKLPNNNTPIHYLKNVTLLKPINKIEEKDMFKKRIDSLSYYKLYIKSTIADNSQSVREGILTIFDDTGETNFPIGESEIDSIALEWGFNKLVKSKER